MHMGKNPPYFIRKWFWVFSNSPFASNELALQNLDGLVNFIQWGKNFLPMHF